MKTAEKVEKEEKTEERQPLTGPVEEPKNECEKKIFDVLNQMGIPHVGTVGECSLDHRATRGREDGGGRGQVL